MRRIIALILFLLFYYISLAKGGGAPGRPESGFNWITIWLGFFFGVLFTMLFRFLNRHSKAVDQRRDAAQPLSGWILFLGFNLIVRIVIQIILFWKADYFLKSTWNHLAETGGVRFHSLFIFEMFLNLFALGGTGALIYWFFGRRDIFPSMFIYYVVFYLASYTVLMIAYQNMNLPGDMISLRHDIRLQLFRIVYASAWVLYVWKSEQVRTTFVYPPNG